MEKIVAGVIRDEELSQLNARVSAYYDAFSDRERKDDAAWGEFGETELAHIGS
jgi:hypothetical protein